MLAGSHILAGAAIYRLAEDKPWWVRWPAVVGGGFMSHFVLDSMTTYHMVYGTKGMPWDNTWWPACNVAYILVQAFAVSILWGATAAEGKTKLTMILPPALLSGLWAWLCWDAEYFIGSHWLHLTSATSWAPRLIHDASHNPWTGLWEVGLVVGLLALIWRAYGSQRETSRDAAGVHSDGGNLRGAVGRPE